MGGVYLQVSCRSRKELSTESCIDDVSALMSNIFPSCICGSNEDSAATSVASARKIGAQEMQMTPTTGFLEQAKATDAIRLLVCAANWKLVKHPSPGAPSALRFQRAGQNLN